LIGLLTALFTSLLAFLWHRVSKSKTSLVTHDHEHDNDNEDNNDDDDAHAHNHNDSELMFRFISDFIGLTWINTIIFGAPILSAMYGPQLGIIYPVLASLSSFLFQLPLLLILFEIGMVRRRRAAARDHDRDCNHDSDRDRTVCGAIAKTAYNNQDEDMSSCLTESEIDCDESDASLTSDANNRNQSNSRDQNKLAKTAFSILLRVLKK
jgi:hypothetical protein